MLMRDPLRGEVWRTRFPNPIGWHPAVVLSNNPLNAQLASVVVLLITGTEGPPETHHRVSPDAGLTGYDESFINVTDLHSVDKSRLRTYKGRLDPVELARIAEMVRVYLGL
jgi:mRNA interferase MazF